MQWIKLIGGLVAALFLFFIAGLCVTTLINTPNITPGGVQFLGSVALVTGGLGSGLGVYLWRSG